VGGNPTVTPHATRSSGRKDLQDLRNLPRAPFLSYLQKQAQPSARRSRLAASQPAKYPALAAFSPANLCAWITQYLGHRIGRRHPFAHYAKGDRDNGVYRLQGDGGEIRIALAGDWASGTDEAEDIAGLIRAFKPHYSIHLGDIYYVGDADETDENFLGIRNPHNDYEPCCWPAGSRGSFALNGNHEMYALGNAYFDRILPRMGPVIDGRAQGQRASYFCLENEHWRIIALDTGYNSIGLPVIEYFLPPDCGLRPEQLDWLRNVVQPRRDDPRGIVLLTHHPYVSRFDRSYPKPARQLAEFLSGPVLWFWGHEHRIAIYEEVAPADGVRTFGRCIGHGGMPVDLSPETPPHPQYRVEFVDDRRYPNDENLIVGFNGFARLLLRENLLIADYVDVLGAVVFSETWTVERGMLTRRRAGQRD
jgi:hypothetical protein